jgi:hypothetical protein
MIERQLDIATKDGASTTFIVHPDRGGPFPVIVFLMDAPAIREELRDMARRFASINDQPIREDERKFDWPQGPRPIDGPRLAEVDF